MCNFKKLLTIAFVIFSLPLFAKKLDNSKLKVYSAVDVVKHNSKKSCWVVMGKYIYDVTKFLGDHPGSYKVLFKCCGKDCTKGYADKKIDEPHTKKSHKIRDKMLLGILKEKM